VNISISTYLKKFTPLFIQKPKIFLYVFRACRANLLRGVVKCTSAAGPNGDPWIALSSHGEVDFGWL
jgi:hypothetical protein